MSNWGDIYFGEKHRKWVVSKNTTSLITGYFCYENWVLEILFLNLWNCILDLSHDQFGYCCCVVCCNPTTSWAPKPIQQSTPKRKQVNFPCTWMLSVSRKKPPAMSVFPKNKVRMKGGTKNHVTCNSFGWTDLQSLGWQISKKPSSETAESSLFKGHIVWSAINRKQLHLQEDPPLPLSELLLLGIALSLSM